MDEYKDLRTYVLKIMDEDNLGVREFARRLHVSHPTVSDILSGGQASLKTCKAISEYKRVPLSMVLKLAKLDNEPLDNESSKEILLVVNMLDEDNKMDVRDYARMKLKQQNREKENSKNVRRDRVP